MAEKKRLLDVWIVDGNMVYREVPFTVVTDWLQECRLLPADRVRLTGTASWHQVGKVPAFAPYLPRAEPDRAEDKAEALEPVDMGLHWKNRADADDEDVDMIPLIDISLVLLIFFMMTASVDSGLFSPIKTPAAKHQLSAIAKDMLWIGIDVKDKNGKSENGPDGNPMPWYSLGADNKVLEPPARDLGAVIARLGEAIGPSSGEIRLRIRADLTLPIETINNVTLDVQGLENRLNGRQKQQKVKFVITGEVSAPKDK